MLDPERQAPEQASHHEFRPRYHDADVADKLPCLELHNAKEDAMRYFAVVMTLAVMVAGCATAAPPRSAAVDVTGRWTGSWEGFGIFEVKRDDVATAQFRQQDGVGHGRFWLEGTLTSESVPLHMRLAGATGVPVALEINGNHIVMRHRGDDRLFKAEFVVRGDRMIGRLLNTELPGRIVLDRVRDQVAAAPPPVIAAPPPAPDPPPAATEPVPDPPPAAAEPAPDPPPAAAEPAPPAPTTVASLPSPQEFSATDAVKPVHFNFNRSDIAQSETDVLDANVRWLQTNRDVLVLIEGHCDVRGTEEYNLALGERRARSVRDYLLAHGVAAERITTVSYGDQRPICTEETEDCWRQNRRAAFVTKPR
jgi:peptidoglycan-associated lipoprotein